MADENTIGLGISRKPRCRDRDSLVIVVELHPHRFPLVLGFHFIPDHQRFDAMQLLEFLNGRSRSRCSQLLIGASRLSWPQLGHDRQ
jgi:hypothetical protein